MPAQKGKDLLLKVDSDGLGTFVTVAGLRSRSLAFNAETVDITHAECAGRWRELLAGAGVKHARVTGAGIFKDASSDALIRDYVFAGTIRDWQVIIPDFGTVEGPFQISSFELTGCHDAEVAVERSLDSAGELTFAPEGSDPAGLTPWQHRRLGRAKRRPNASEVDRAKLLPKPGRQVRAREGHLRLQPVP